MHLGLSYSPLSFQDGSSSWNDSAADALATWNQYINKVQFVPSSQIAGSGGDGENSVFFSKTVYGEQFGNRVLAITLNYSGGTTFTETDVIFNNALKWSSYRGPLQPSGNTYTWDFHRVALHEFGHVLGLDHPDKHGQPDIEAQMNSIISDLDHLADDDIAGARSLYASAPLQAATGSEVSYQVQSNLTGGTFSASNLPPGLTIDPTSGLISGIATISGQYHVTVVITSPGTSRTLIVDINVTAPPIPAPGSSTLLKTLPLNVAQLAADPARDRLYATLPASYSVAIIDTISLTVIKTLPMYSTPFGLSISADGSKLWVGNSNSANPGVSVIDLATLESLPMVLGPQFAFDVAEGLAGRLYLSSSLHSGSLVQMDSSTGALQGILAGPFASDPGFLRVSPDRRTLFYAAKNGSRLQKYDISGPTAVLLQNTFASDNGQDLAVSHDGRYLIYSGSAGNSGYPIYSTARFETADLDLPVVSYPVGPYPSQVVFNNDDTILYQAVQGQGKIDLIDTSTFTLRATLFLVPQNSGYSVPEANDIALDRTGSSLFYATSSSTGPGELRVYATAGAVLVTPASVPPLKTLLNVSTRLRSQAGDNVLIGGFIISGTGPKKIALRGIGPSMQLAGRLEDPVLELRSGDGSLLASNDNWNSHRAETLSTGLAPADEHEAVISATLSPGAYTAILRGVNDSTGVALVEVYDLTPASNSRIANLSTRGKVETGDNVMIGGFIIGGDQPTEVMVRALGPSLGSQGVSEPLTDTTLTLYNGSGTALASNDDWQNEQEQEIVGANLAPGDARESAIIRTLPAGNYTAIVRGKNETSGVALVEVFNLAPN